MKREMKWDGTHIITIKAGFLDVIMVCLREEIPLHESVLIKNIFSVNEGFFHASEVQVSPGDLEGEKKFPSINKAGQLN